MKRYRLLEASAGLYESDAAAKETIAKSIKHTLAPIEGKTFTLDWDKVEDKLGGPIPYKVKMAVEKECGGFVFTGAKVFGLLTKVSFALLALSGSSILFVVLFFKTWLVALLIFGISVSILLIFALIHKKRIDETGINECVSAAKRGEIDSYAAWAAINDAATPDLIHNETAIVCAAVIVIALVILMSKMWGVF